MSREGLTTREAATWMLEAFSEDLLNHLVLFNTRGSLERGAETYLRVYEES